MIRQMAIAGVFMFERSISRHGFRLAMPITAARSDLFRFFLQQFAILVVEDHAERQLPDVSNWKETVTMIR